MVIVDESSVSVIIPTYNEADNIKQITTRVLDALPSYYTTEVIIVDDDSPDRTWEIAEQAYRADGRVRVIRRTNEKGLSTAVTRGFQESRHEFCAVIDADLQHPPEKLSDLFSALADGADIAIGSRNVAGGGVENWPLHRHLVSKGATLFAQIGVPAARRVSDPMSGFFAVRRTLVSDVELTPRGYKILLEILAKCDYETVAEVPYLFHDRERGESKLTPTQYQRFVEHVLGLGITSSRLSRYVSPSKAVRAMEFGLIGAIGAVLNTLLFSVLHLGSGVHYLLAGAMAFIAALNFNFVGNWAVTFNRPTSGIWAKYYRFNAVSLAGFLLYTAVLITSVQYLLVPALIANVLAICGSALFNFLGTDGYAFDTTDAVES